MTVYFSIGSNLGDRAGNLLRAVEGLQRAGIIITRKSSLYETEPQDVRDQPWFLNAAIEGETALQPLDILRAALETEAGMGRIRENWRGPRLIDIDVLLYGGAILFTGELHLPHPRMKSRRFVLEPLVEIAPDLRDPETGLLFRELLAAVRDQDLRLYRSDWNTGAP